jgi:exonuclease VII small subunit
MMNRNLMNRQMFRDGGAAFPDLSGDGKVTQKDILIGRGVVPMQQGGISLTNAQIQKLLQVPEVRYFLENSQSGNLYEYVEQNPEVLKNLEEGQEPELKVNKFPIEELIQNSPEARKYMEESPSGNLYEFLEKNNLNPLAPEVDRQLELLRRQELLQSQPGRMSEQEMEMLRQPPVNPEVDRQLELLRRQELLQSQPGRMSEQEMEMLRRQAPVYGMQEGGMAPMAMPPQGMMPAAPPAAMPEMAQAQQAGMDPAILEQMLSQASQGIMDLDEAEDYEQVMNSMRETDATIEERRMELADIVGEQDAQQTPESVLTLVQPVMMMAKVDEGIGGLAQGAMTEPVTGDMAGGIMSTVNMGAEEGPAPVNFNQGGVVGMRMGGDPFAAFSAPSFNRIDPYSNLIKSSQPQDVDTLYTQNLNRLLNVIGDPTAKNKEDEDFRKAQMFFSIAKSAANFASPKEKRMSPADVS